jgi:hypothetical protein
MAKMGMNDSQKKMFDDFSSLNAKQSAEKLASLKAEEAAGYAANKAASDARDAIEEKAELEDRKLTAAEETQFKLLGKELNASSDRITAAQNAQEILEKVEDNKNSTAIFASETASKIAEDLGLKQIEIAEKSSEEQQTILTDHQKTTLKYAYTDAEGKQMQLENAKKLVESEKNTIADKNKQIEAIQTAADGNELTNREKSRIARLQKEIENSKETLSYREQDLEVYANIDKLKAETEIKTKTNVTEEQLAAQAEATKRLEQLKADGLIAETESASAIQVIKSDALSTELAKLSESEFKKQEALRTSVVETLKINGKAVDPSSDSGKAALDKVKSEMAKVTTGAGMPGMPDFSTMFGSEKGKLPPFLESLNAKVKDMKPVSIPTPKEENKIAGNTAQAIKKEPSPGKKINPETGEEYTPVPPAPKKDTKPAVGAVEQVGLKDLHASLEHLNKSMAQLLSYSQQTASAAQAQVKATKSLSGNKFAQ